MKSHNACLTGHVISMLIHSPTTRIQDLGILSGCGVYYATDNSQLSFAGRRDPFECMQTHRTLLFCARDPRAFRGGTEEGNVNQISVDPPLQIAKRQTRRAVRRAERKMI